MNISSIPFRCRREDVNALPYLYRLEAEKLIEKGEIEIIEKVS
jgi:hypothetical protein